jgi:hypothetical protein
MKNVFGIFGVLGSLVSLGLFVAAALEARETSAFLASAESTTGTVIGLRAHVSSGHGRSQSHTWRPVVRYTAEGASYTFESSVGSKPPAYDAGDQVEVRYPPGHPDQGRLNSLLEMWFAPAIKAVLGLVLLAAALGPILFIRRRRNRIRDLLATGQRVEATVTAVAPDTSMRRNGRSPFRITAQWIEPGTNLLRVFKSERIWFDPSGYLPKDGRIGVFMDAHNARKYYVDTTFLPEQAK